MSLFWTVVCIFIVLPFMGGGMDAVHSVCSQIICFLVFLVLLAGIGIAVYTWMPKGNPDTGHRPYRMEYPNYAANPSPTVPRAQLVTLQP
jgi:hypothetical protein